jgi:hypothetical protein
MVIGAATSQEISMSTEDTQPLDLKVAERQLIDSG